MSRTELVDFVNKMVPEEAGIIWAHAKWREIDFDNCIMIAEAIFGHRFNLSVGAFRNLGYYRLEDRFSERQRKGILERVGHRMVRAIAETIFPPHSDQLLSDGTILRTD